MDQNDTLVQSARAEEKVAIAIAGAGDERVM